MKNQRFPVLNPIAFRSIALILLFLLAGWGSTLQAQIDPGRLQIGTDFGFLIQAADGNSDFEIRIGGVVEYWLTEQWSIGGALGYTNQFSDASQFYIWPQANFYPGWCNSETIHLFAGVNGILEFGELNNYGFGTPIGLMVLTPNKKVAFSVQYPLFLLEFFKFEGQDSATTLFSFGTNFGLLGRVTFALN